MSPGGEHRDGDLGGGRRAWHARSGPVLGAFFVNGGKSLFTQSGWPEAWLFVLGALFIAVTLFLPQGLIGLIRRLRR